MGGAARRSAVHASMPVEPRSSAAVAEAGAGEARAVLDTFFDSAPVGLALFDRDLRFRRVNAALAWLDGVPAEAHIGRTVLDVLPDQGSEVEDLLRGVLEIGEAIGAELSGLTPGAPVRHHWLVSLHRVCDAAGEILGVGATVTDITERVAAEQRARFLARAGEVLGRSLDFETTLRDVASIAVPDRADWCVIDLLEPGGSIRRVAVAHTEPEKERLRWELATRYPSDLEGPSVLSTVLRTGEPILVREVDDAMLRAGARDAEHLEILRSLDVTGGVIAPLVVRGRVIGAITFAFSASRLPAQIDLDLATDLARLAASAIDNARVHRDRSRIARTLQRSLLPPRLPRIAGFDIAARYRAAGEGNVGGDFYDVFQRTDSSWVLVLGDVCGKGAEAAALTVLARHTLRAAAIATGAPEDLLDSLNEAVLRDRAGSGSGDRFMTAVSGCLDLGPDDPTLTIGVAGHPPPIVVQAAAGAEPLALAGRALGLTPGVEVGSSRVALQPGDALLLYTDGVLDAGAPRRPLSVAELAAAAAGAAGEPAARIAEAVERAALERVTGEPRDDIAIVVLRRDPVGR